MQINAPRHRSPEPGFGWKARKIGGGKHGCPLLAEVIALAVVVRARH